MVITMIDSEDLHIAPSENSRPLGTFVRSAQQQYF